jgi:hypothetical protein
MPRTVDRGEILYRAARARLSPALRAGAPALVPVDETDGRCGWAPFFAALEARGMAVTWEDEDPGSVRVAPAS